MKRKTFKNAQSVVLKQNAEQNIIHTGLKHLIIVIKLERWDMMFRKCDQKIKEVIQFKIGCTVSG